MSEEIPYICVPSKYGEMTRQRLLKLDLFDTDYRILSEDDLLFFPLKDSIDPSVDFSELSNSDIGTGLRVFPRSSEGPKTLHQALQDVLTEEECKILPRAYDLIGDIAVLEIPAELARYRHRIGTEFLRLHPNFETILGKRSAVSGTLRLRDYELLAGVNKTDTIHIEYGCHIAVDLSKAYFSPRLLEEHHRIARQVTNEENIVDMFTGVGPFALHIARESRATVTAVDINPDAIALLKRSMMLNRLEGRILPLSADIRSYAATTEPGFADRVIMNHPSGSSEFVDTACRLLKKEGTMHYYDFMGGEYPERSLEEKIRGLVELTGRVVKDVLLIRRVRDSAPYEYHMVIDAIIGQ